MEEKNSAPAPNPAQDKHPPAMRAYVERVFAAGIPPERKAAVQVNRLMAYPCPDPAPEAISNFYEVK